MRESLIEVITNLLEYLSEDSLVRVLRIVNYYLRNMEE